MELGLSFAKAGDEVQSALYDGADKNAKDFLDAVAPFALNKKIKIDRRAYADTVEISVNGFLADSPKKEPQEENRTVISEEMLTAAQIHLRERVDTYNDKIAQRTSEGIHGPDYERDTVIVDTAKELLSLADNLQKQKVSIESYIGKKPQAPQTALPKAGAA